MPSGDRAAEQYEQDQPSLPIINTGDRVTVLTEFSAGDHIWYQPPEDTDEYAGVVDEFTPAGTMRITTRRWVNGQPHLVHNIVGQYAINQGRLYRRTDGTDITADIEDWGYTS